MCWEGVISGGRNEGGQLKGDTYQRRLMAKSSSGKNAVSHEAVVVADAMMAPLLLHPTL